AKVVPRRALEREGAGDRVRREAGGIEDLALEPALEVVELRDGRRAEAIDLLLLEGGLERGLVGEQRHLLDAVEVGCAVVLRVLLEVQVAIGVEERQDV